MGGGWGFRAPRACRVAARGEMRSRRESPCLTRARVSVPVCMCCFVEQVLADLAVNEPYSFGALVHVTKNPV